MRIRKVAASAGNVSAPIMMEVEGEEEGKADGAETEAQTASFPDEERSPPLSYLNYRRLEEVGHEVNWKWKRQSLQGHHVARIRVPYKKVVFEDIRSVLTDVGGKELLQQFVGGCFGHLMHLTGVSICKEALQELISREIVLSGAQENELWFRIGVTNIRFSHQEYALVTGLRFGSSSFDPHKGHPMPKDGVCKRFFKKGCSITVQDLWNKFNSKHLGRSEEVYLKVAHILALYLVVLGYGQTKVVDGWVWVLAENLDSWKIFPWGAYTYRALMHYIRLLPESREDVGQAYNFLGPAWVLQIWGYEAIPLLGSTCATITGKVTVPRCCNWLSRTRKIKINLAHFFKKELVCLEKLHPTDEEKEELYWLSVQCTQPLGVRYTHPQRSTRAEGSVRAPLAFDLNVLSQQPHSASAEHADLIEDPASDDSTWSPSPRPKCKRVSRHLYGDKNDTIPCRIPQGFDEAHFLNQVSDKMVDRLIEPVLERLSQQLIPRMKQLIESGQSPSKQSPPQTSREVHDQLEVVLDSPFLRVDPPVNCEESAKAAERKMEKQSNDGGSSSMNFAGKGDNGHSSREKTEPVPKDAIGGEEQLEVLNAPRLDTCVSAVEKSSAKGEDAIDRIHEKQIGSSKRLKGELKRKSGTSPHREGDKANTAKKKKSKAKKSRHSPSSSEDESSSGDERRRKQKKRSKKKKPKHHKSSSFESSTDSDRHWRKKNKHKSHRRRSISPEASDSGSR